MKQIIFIVEINIEGEGKEIIKKIRAARTAIKTGVNNVEGVKATRITNKDN